MESCNMEKVFERYLPAGVVPTVRGHFDMAWSVSGTMAFGDVLPDDEVSFRFSDNLNVICGPPGSGKTRLLEVIKYNGPDSLPADETMAQMEIDLGPLSASQQLMSSAQILLEMMPYSYCMLVDDVLEELDEERKRRFLDVLANGEKQVIMTAPWEGDEARRMAEQLNASVLILGPDAGA